MAKHIIDTLMPMLPLESRAIGFDNLPYPVYCQYSLLGCGECERALLQSGAAVNCDPVGSELHGLGSSINCLGRRVTSYTTRDAKEIAKLLAMLP